MLSLLSLLFSFTYKKKKGYINNNIYIYSIRAQKVGTVGENRCNACGSKDRAVHTLVFKVWTKYGRPHFLYKNKGKEGDSSFMTGSKQ